MLKYEPYLKNHSRQLRNNMTDAEQLLWDRLRRKQISGVQFYRQKPIGRFIVDFYAPAIKLVVELDGGQHFEQAAQEKDEMRDAFFRQQGLDVMRFDNARMMNETDAVLEKIFEFAQGRVNPP
jgi:very-short-patch-repair endonuclease